MIIISPRLYRLDRSLLTSDSVRGLRAVSVPIAEAGSNYSVAAVALRWTPLSQTPSGPSSKPAFTSCD